MEKYINLRTILAIIIPLLSELTSAKDVHGCFDLQRTLVQNHGRFASNYYWFPKCLAGGYYLNVQCDYYGCFCAYVDTGAQIPDTVSNALVDFMKENCPWLSQKVTDPCSVPPADYPCQATSKKFYFNPANGKCEANSRSCLGFESSEACEESCVVQKKHRCNFKAHKGKTCDRREPGERWYHDEKQGSCRPFLYGGCGGNSNNYREKWICLKTCETQLNTELIIQVEKTKYIISLPTWLVVQRLFVPSAPNVLTVEQFKDIEGYMVEIAKFPVSEGEEPEEPKEKQDYEKYRPEHAPKNMTREELCTKKMSRGPCRGLMPRWYFDPEQSKCIKFNYGGCYGNENRHVTATGCAVFCQAEVPPSEVDRIEDLINTGGKIGGLPEKPKELDGSRTLGLGGLLPTNKPEEKIIGEAEVEFEFDTEETTEKPTKPT